MTEEIIIRASSLGNYADCPGRSACDIIPNIIIAMGYTLREKSQGIGAAAGTAVHAAGASMLKHKALTGELSPEDATNDEAIQTLKKATKDGVQFDKATADLNIAEQQVLRMARVYRFSVAPKIQPIIVEQRLEGEVKPGLILSGQSDVIAREPGCVIDLKTGTKRRKYTSQIGAYALLARSTGIDITKGRVDFIERSPLTKYKKPFPQADVVHDDVPIAYAEQTAHNVVQHIYRDIRNFKEGNDELRLGPGDTRSFLKNPSSMLCGAKYCRGHGTSWCEEHAPVIDEEE